MRTLTFAALSIAVLATACGGGKKESTTPDEAAGAGGRDYRGEESEDPCQGGMCPPETLDAALKQVPGVMENGLFLRIAHAAIVAGPDGVVVLDRDSDTQTG